MSDEKIEESIKYWGDTFSRDNFTKPGQTPLNVDDIRRMHDVLTRARDEWAQTVEPPKPDATIEIYHNLPPWGADRCTYPQAGKFKIFLQKDHSRSPISHIPQYIVAAHELGHALGFMYGLPGHQGMMRDYDRFGGVAGQISPNVYPTEVEAWEMAEHQMQSVYYAKQYCLRNYAWAKEIHDKAKEYTAQNQERSGQ